MVPMPMLPHQLHPLRIQGTRLMGVQWLRVPHGCAAYIYKVPEAVECDPIADWMDERAQVLATLRTAVDDNRV